MTMGFSGQGKNHQARGEHVKPMYGWLVDTFEKQRLNPFNDTVLILRAASWYGQESSRFLDNNK